MSDAQMKINVGANVSDAVNGFDKMSDGIKVAGLSIQDASRKLDELSISFEKFRGQGFDTSGIEANMEALENRIKSLQEAAQKKIALSIDTSSIADAENKSGLLLNTIAKQRIAFQDVGRLVTGEGFSLLSLTRNFTLFNPAVVIAAAGIAYFGSELVKFLTKATDAELAQKKLNETLADSGASKTGEVAEIKDLTALILDETEARNVRERAFKKLQDEYPNAFANMSLEKTSLADISAATDKVTAALLRQAQIKGLSDAITDIYKEIAKESVKSSSETTTAMDKINIAFQELKSGIYLFHPIQAFTTAQDDVANKEKQENTKTYNAQIDALNDKMKQLLETGLKLNDDVILGKKDIAKKNLEGVLQLLEQIKSARENLSRNDEKTPNFQKEAKTQEAPNTDVLLLQDKIAKAIQLGNSIGTANSKQYASILADLYQQEINKIKFPNIRDHVDFTLQDPKIKLQGLDKENAKIESDIEKALNLKDIHVKVPIYIENAIKDDSSLNEKQKEVILKSIRENATKNIPTLLLNIPVKAQFKPELDKAQIEEFQQKFTNLFQQLAASGIDSFASSIGNALAGAKNPFGPLLEFLGTALEDVGKLLITSSTVVQGIKSFISTGILANPALGIPLGIAAIAAGAFLKAEVSKELGGGHSFAEGGAISGPGTGTSDSILARVSHGEYIVRAASVAQPGMRGLLDTINSGRFKANDLSTPFAVGGFVNDLSPAFTVSNSTLSAAAHDSPGRSPFDINIRGKLSGVDLLLSGQRAQRNQNLV